MNWPQLVPFSFWAVNRPDRDRKLQWLTRALRLDDIDWQYIIDLVAAQADPPVNSRQAQEILDRLDVGAAATMPSAAWVGQTRCMFADAGYQAMATAQGAAWAVRVGNYRIEITDFNNDLGTNPWDTYIVSVCPYNSPVKLVSVQADDATEALALGAEARADPEKFIDDHRVRAAA